MKASKEIRAWVKRLIAAHGKKNGTVSGCYFDSPEMEIKSCNDKKIPRQVKALHKFKAQS